MKIQATDLGLAILVTLFESCPKGHPDKKLLASAMADRLGELSSSKMATIQDIMAVNQAFLASIQKRYWPMYFVYFVIGTLQGIRKGIVMQFRK